MKVIFKFNFILLLALLLVSCNYKTSQKKKSSNNDWRPLFNGKNLDGWLVKLCHHELGDNYANTFRVVDGNIQVNYEDYPEFGQRFGHLFYHQPFSAYHLKFEYRFTDQWMEDAPTYAYRNSGIMFHSQDPKSILKDQNWPFAVEYQFLAEETFGVERSTGNVCTPGTHIFMDGELNTKHCINSSSSTYKWNQWVSGELIVNEDGSIFHLVNGDTVLQYSKPIIGGAVVKDFDPAIKIEGKSLSEGYIGLQAEGQGVEFREINIKELD